MRNKLFFYIVCALISSCGFSQSLSQKESSKLENIVYNYFDNSTLQNDLKETYPSEAFLFFLTTNEKGEIESVHFLSDSNDKGVGFTILSKITKNDFKDWKVEKSKNKTIMFPIAVISPGNKNVYAKNFGGLRSVKTGESGNLIVLPGFSYGKMINKH